MENGQNIKNKYMESLRENHNITENDIFFDGNVGLEIIKIYKF